MANSNSDHVVAAKRILVADPIHEQGRAFLTARPGLTPLRNTPPGQASRLRGTLAR